MGTGKNKRNFSLEYFFFGCSSSSKARFGYLIKRIVWCLVVISAIRYWIALLWGLLGDKDISSLILIFPVFVFTAIALLFRNFD